MDTDLSIFYTLMKFFRSHIARLTGFFMLMIGMALHHTIPSDNESGQNGFTSWLGSHLKTQDDSVMDKIDELASGDQQLEEVIRRASEIVYSHSDDFELPVSNENDTTEEDLYKLLLTEWNSFRNSGNGMGKAVLIEHIKPQTVIPSDGHLLGYAVTKTTPGFDVYNEFALYNIELAPSESYILSPLKSGTAIGAP